MKVIVHAAGVLVGTAVPDGGVGVFVRVSVGGTAVALPVGVCVIVGCVGVKVRVGVVVRDNVGGAGVLVKVPVLVGVGVLVAVRVPIIGNPAPGYSVDDIKIDPTNVTLCCAPSNSRGKPALLMDAETSFSPRRAC